MSRVVEWPLDDGEVVLIEVAEEQSGLERVGRGSAAVREAGETFQDALRRIGPAIGAVVAQVRESSVVPDRVAVKFGVKFSVAAGAIIAKSSGEANFEVTVEWSKMPPVSGN